MLTGMGTTKVYKCPHLKALQIVRNVLLEVEPSLPLCRGFHSITMAGNAAHTWPSVVNVTLHNLILQRKPGPPARLRW